MYYSRYIFSAIAALLLNAAVIPSASAQLAIDPDPCQQYAVKYAAQVMRKLEDLMCKVQETYYAGGITYQQYINDMDHLRILVSSIYYDTYALYKCDIRDAMLGPRCWSKGAALPWQGPQPAEPL